jgi:hypothetical protein
MPSPQKIQRSKEQQISWLKKIQGEETELIEENKRLLLKNLQENADHRMKITLLRSLLRKEYVKMLQNTDLAK